MKKRILITSTDLMMVQFLLPHVRNLSDAGFDVTLACADVGGRMEEIRAALPGTQLHPVSMKRSPLSPRNLLGFIQLKRLTARGSYEIIWTNEPVMGALTRLAAGRSGAKVVYLCHGFHFYRGCPLAFRIFRPVEDLLSRRTDVLVTINREDEAAARAMHAGCTAFLHGVGVDTKRLNGSQGDFRRELGLKAGDFLILAVGELNKNKNHQIILRAMALLRDPEIHLCICGKGPLEAELKALARALGLEAKVHFPGYRRDMGAVYAAGDLMVHPSCREGLGLAPLEGMYCGLPLIASHIRGPRDYCDAEFLVPPGDAAGFAQAISRLKADPILRRRVGERNREIAARYTLERAGRELMTLMEGL